MRERRMGLWRPGRARRKAAWLPPMMGLGLLTLANAAHASEAVQLPPFTSSETGLIWFAMISGIISLIVGGIWFGQVKSQSAGTVKMEEVGKAIRDGALAYLLQQVKTMSAACRPDCRPAVCAVQGTNSAWLRHK